MFNLFENMISINLREVTPSRPIPLGPEHAGTMVCIVKKLPAVVVIYESR